MRTAEKSGGPTAAPMASDRYARAEGGLGPAKRRGKGLSWFQAEGGADEGRRTRTDMPVPTGAPRAHNFQRGGLSAYARAGSASVLPGAGARRNIGWERAHGA